MVSKEKKPFNYHVYEDTGNDELKHFAVKLTIGDRMLAKARATSKKKAEEKHPNELILHYRAKLKISNYK